MCFWSIFLFFEIDVFVLIPYAQTQTHMQTHSIFKFVFDNYPLKVKNWVKELRTMLGSDVCLAICGVLVLSVVLVVLVCVWLNGCG